MIAGTGSGVGKTSLAIGLARLLTRKSLRVQTFKVGPDFLDPTYLALASGRTCYNLDGWMTSRQYVGELFARAARDADVALIEGVMGLFDGASPSTIEGSTAEIARWLDAPVLLVANAHGAARSLAATVRGFTDFEPGVRVVGVIANQGGSERHRQWLAESLAAASGPPLVGMLPRGSLPALPSRHLGLVTADQAGLSDATLDQLADACEKYIDIPALLELAQLDRRAAAGGTPLSVAKGVLGGPTTPFATLRDVPPNCHTYSLAGPKQLENRASPPDALTLTLCRHRPEVGRERGHGSDMPHTSRVRLGIARDEAFHFYYPDNLEMLEHGGVEWVPFSPLRDAQLPADLDGLYFGGGYPELYASRLAENAGMLDDVRAFAASGRCVYAECGGLMYLGRTLTTIEGVRCPLAGVLPLETTMLPKLKVLGYTEVTWTAESLWGDAGQTVRGHEFHFSEIAAADGPADGWQSAYSIRRRGAEPAREGFVRGNVLAGYVHLHWASRPEAMRHFLSRCKERS